MTTTLGETEAVALVGRPLDSSQLQTFLRSAQPDVLIVGGSAPRGYLEALRIRAPRTALVMLTSPPRLAEEGLRLLRLGVTALPLSVTTSLFCHAVQLAAGGKAALFLDASGGRWLERSKGVDLIKLTVREIEVLLQIQPDRSFGQIGVALGIKTSTARSHAHRICAKLGKSSVSELYGVLVSHPGR